MKRHHYVELLHLPQYRQGTHDALCTYYACAILLGALFPEYRAAFGQGPRHRGRRSTVRDPFLRHAVAKGTTPEHVLASWFFRGLEVKRAYRILNRVMREEGHATRFQYREGTRGDATFELIARSIDVGLPVLLGMHTEDLGNHAVVVHGYERGQLRWLLLRDPADGRAREGGPGGDERIAWEVLRATMNGPLQIVIPDTRTHVGPRPDRLVVRRGRSQTERWWFVDGTVGYFDVEDLAGSAML